MPVICWGALAKSATELTTIDDEIQSYIQRHNTDPSAHGLDGYALFNHRDDPYLDHVDYCIVSDKISADWIIGKKFETSPAVGPGTDGVIFDPEGIMMYQAGVRKVNIPKSGNPEFKGHITVSGLYFDKNIVNPQFESFDGWSNELDGVVTALLSKSSIKAGPVLNEECAIKAYIDMDDINDLAAKNPYFETRVCFEDNTRQDAIFGFGTYLSDDFYIGFGFQNDQGTLYLWTDDGSVSNRLAIVGVDLTIPHTYSAFYTGGSDIKFYVDGVLRGTRSTNLPVEATDEFNGFFYYLRNKVVNYQPKIRINSLVYGWDF